ncbi:transcription cofactor vestigial-like protein 2 [Galendromus occidentalis]|uniref:Transcription cofactor vestigial-like protein 2 n=1 Tax=Galendromus occidentalis TaxID=34638 RepID=A0AAJ7L5E8_9ACAR|nr:transcription cofactor vestigial-like protein 2 [Galendromus occidentalis]
MTRVAAPNPPPTSGGYFIAGPSSPQDFVPPSAFVEQKPENLHFEKFSSPPALKENYSSPSPPHGLISPGTSSPTIAPIDLPSTSTAVCSPSPEVLESKDDVGEATYVSPKCVVIKYYKTDVASVLDDHFQKALAQAGFGGPSRRSDDDTMDSKPLSQRNLPQSFFCPPNPQSVAASSGSYPPSPSSTSSYPQAGPSQASPQIRASPSQMNGPSPSHLASHSGHPSPSYLPLPSTSSNQSLTDFYPPPPTPSSNDYESWSHYVHGYRAAHLSPQDLQTYAVAANRHQFAQHQVSKEPFPESPKSPKSPNDPPASPELTYLTAEEPPQVVRMKMYNSLLNLGNQQQRASCSAAVLGVNEKVMDTWGQSVARYHEQIQMNINMSGHPVAIQEPYPSNYAHPMSAAMTGLEATADTKDMYWF